MTDAEVRWCVLVRPAGSNPGDDVGVDVSITILESEECDGSEGGCNFGLDLVEYGGIVVGGMVPFNFTEQVWIPREDADAVRARWAIFDDGFSASAVMDRIENFYRERE